MSRTALPATVMICAPLPRHATGRRPAEVPVTWIASLDTLLTARIPDGGLALELDADTLASKQALRSTLTRARAVAPTLDTIAVRGGRLEHRGLLAAAGIRVALVDGFDDVSRGHRRPAPQGWRCRTVEWGLWEVASGPAQRGGLRGLLAAAGFGAAPRAGELRVVRDTDSRIERWMAWAVRRQRHGTVAAATLSELPVLVERRHGDRQGGSVLRAA